ncbi:PREDICTED: defensin-like protein 206 [Camelina sativa]|uniref:Defensin-like protein 206 n=1 Tax=Camelina sativa TaxID=90675 RepID=A0ABM1RPD3_CAMSA|nr:PREDICTED: defensin-like protein 206 [Camelina sativa]
MAKNLNSVSFTVLLLVLLTASTGILKSEAQTCSTFLDECGPAPFLGTNADCFKCCKYTYGSPPACKGLVEGSDKHCHCYQNP